MSHPGTDKYAHTAMCCYNTVQYNTILHTWLWWLIQSINGSLNPQNTPYNSPQRASYEVSFVMILEKIDRMGLLPDTQNCGLRMRRECRECFPRHSGLAIPTCITARAWRPTHNFTYLIRGPLIRYRTVQCIPKLGTFFVFFCSLSWLDDRQTGFLRQEIARSM